MHDAGGAAEIKDAADESLTDRRRQGFKKMETREKQFDRNRIIVLKMSRLPDCAANKLTNQHKKRIDIWIKFYTLPTVPT